MGAYIGANERFGSGDQDLNQHRLERVIGDSPALESAYREIAELKDKLAQESCTWKMKFVASWTLKELWGRVPLSVMC